MSGNQRPPSGLRSWLQEEAVTTRHPSWIAPKPKSTRPPSQSLPQPAGEPANAEASDGENSADPTESDFASVELGMAAEIARLNEENAGLRAQLAEMASAMAQLRRDVLEASETELVRLATAIAERVVGNELSVKPDLVVSWAHEAIQALASKDEVIIALARDVAQQVPSEAWEKLGVEHKVQMDPALGEGSIEVRTAEGAVASGSAARLAAVSQALGITET